MVVISDHLRESLMRLDLNSIFSETSDFDCDDVISTPYELNDIESCYWETDTLSSQLPHAVLKNIFLHLNIQGLPIKYNNFVTFLNDFQFLPSVIPLSETWLNEFNESSYDISGYHPLIAKSRPDNSDRGGVAFYVREDLNFIERPDLNLFIPFIFESSFITLQPSNITLGVIYRTPSSNSNSCVSLYTERRTFCLLY